MYLCICFCTFILISYIHRACIYDISMTVQKPVYKYIGTVKISPMRSGSHAIYNTYILSPYIYTYIYIYIIIYIYIYMTYLIHLLGISTYSYMLYIYITFIYDLLYNIYIYIERERERERELHCHACLVEASHFTRGAASILGLLWGAHCMTFWPRCYCG